MIGLSVDVRPVLRQRLSATSLANIGSRNLLRDISQISCISGFNGFRAMGVPDQGETRNLDIGTSMTDLGIVSKKAFGSRQRGSLSARFDTRPVLQPNMLAPRNFKRFER